MSGRLGLTAVLITLSGGAALVPASRAAAVPVLAPARPAAPAGFTAGPVSHPDLDHAGSEVSRYESTPDLRPAPEGLPGLDVSGWQRNVGWDTVRLDGAEFAYVKATEGTGYRNPYFAQQYVGSYDAGLIRGAYHFALPDRSPGAAQAAFFASHGGAWTADDRTLPGALDIEYNPYGPVCYGKSRGAMVRWIREFVTRYHARTSRWPVIYTTTHWWRRCTGDYDGFGLNDPLWIARYSGAMGALPAGWTSAAFWQWSSSGLFPGDQDVFNGTRSSLVALANGEDVSQAEAPERHDDH